MLSDLSVKCVVDVTPGSGTLARACLELGLPYTGFTRTNEHSVWLQNVLDTQTIRMVCQAGCPLYNQTLAQALKRHYEEVLVQVDAKNAALDEEFAEEE